MSQAPGTIFQCFHRVLKICTMLERLHIQRDKTISSSYAENSKATIVQVADYLKLIKRTTRRMAGAMQIPPCQVGVVGCSRVQVSTSESADSQGHL